MATMIPRDIEEFTTEGEGKFYRFLAAVAKPDSRYIVWYLPDINGKEPDFLIFSDQVGLIIIEVKDWQLDQIRAANPWKFEIQEGATCEPRRNPLAQAKDYFVAIVERIKEDGRLTSKNPDHHGNAKIPISCGVAFPNIIRHDYVHSHIREVIGEAKIFFADDIHAHSDYAADPSGGRFSEALQSMFPPQFRFTMTAKEFAHLRNILFPDVRIELPERNAPGYADQANRLRLLDHNQEALARKYDGGHCILIGPSGSGKTLILVHKAALLRQYNPAVKSILFLCYNITLVNYIKRLLADKKVSLGPGGVEVYHFFELCSRILGEEVKYEVPDRSYYETVIGLTLDKVKEADLRYDAILVDEGQDLSDDMYRVITALLNTKTNSLTIALDEDQNIYSYPQSWKDLGVQAQGRVHRISSVYRNTIEIARFAAKFVSHKPTVLEKEGAVQPSLFEGYVDYHGPKPTMRQCKDIDHLFAYVADSIAALHEKEGCPYAEIAVIYPSKSMGKGSEVSLPLVAEKALSTRGILSRWASQDYGSKKVYDITTDSVTVSTIHSVKGLDYACVFVVGLDLLEAGVRWSAEQITSLAYVVITRARYHLFMPYVQRTALVDRLLRSL